MPIESMANVQMRIAESRYEDKYTKAQIDMLFYLNYYGKSMDMIKQIAVVPEEEQTLFLGNIALHNQDFSMKILRYIAKPEYSAEKMQELYDRTKLLRDCASAGVTDDVIRMLANPLLNKGQAEALCELGKENPGISLELWDYLSTPGFDERTVNLLYDMSSGLHIYQLKEVTDRTRDFEEIQAYMEAYKSGIFPSNIDKILSRGLNKDQIPEATKGFSAGLPDEIIKAYTPVGEKAAENGVFNRDQMRVIRTIATELWQHVNETADDPEYDSPAVSPVEQCLQIMRPVLDVNLGPYKMKFLGQAIEKGTTTEELDRYRNELFQRFDDDQIGVILYAYHAKVADEAMEVLLRGEDMTAKHMKMIADAYAGQK